MPTYLFHVTDGFAEPPTRAVLPNIPAAKREGVRRAAEMLRDRAEQVSRGEIWTMTVSDATGLALFRLDIVATAAAAAVGK